MALIKVIGLVLLTCLGMTFSVSNDSNRLSNVKFHYLNGRMDFANSDAFKKDRASLLLTLVENLPHGLIYGKEMMNASFPPLKSSDTSFTSIFNDDISLKIDCIKDTFKVIADLYAMMSGSPLNYAVKYADATAKIESGFLEMHWAWPGAYQECLDIDPVYNNQTRHSFAGKHFMIALEIVEMDIPLMPKLLFGVCLPDSCDTNTATFLINYTLKETRLFPYIVPLDGFSSEQVPTDKGTVVAYCVLGLFVLLTAIGTCVDLWVKHQDGQEPKTKRLFLENLSFEATESTTDLLADDRRNETIQEQRRSVKSVLIKLAQSFSFVANTERLMNTSTAIGPMACLNGLRVISMWWVIQGHTYVFAESFLDNLASAGKVVQRFDFQAILNGTFSVDTFFFLSGLLIAYVALKEFRSKGKLNWFYFFGHRYWRLTPMYAVALLLVTKVLIQLINGPYQFMVTSPTQQLYKDYKMCEKYWWTNLLYFNNFYPNEGSLPDNCMPWTWYLANDMQFYVLISPLAIFLLYKKPRFGLVYCSFFIFADVCIRAILTAYYGISTLGGAVQRHKDDWGNAGAFYERPYTRMAVYVVGLVTGFILITSNCKVHMNKIKVVLGWVAAWSTALAIVYGQYYYNSHPNTHMSEALSIAYNSFARLGWSLSLAWLVIACVSGYGGPIHTILSFKFWGPLGRLTFAAYLIHPLVIMGYYLNLEKPLHFTDYTMVYMYLANLVLSYGAAYVLSMIVEAPMMQIEKLLLGGRTA